VLSYSAITLGVVVLALLVGLVVGAFCLIAFALTARPRTGRHR